MAYVSTMILRSMRMIGEKTRGATLTTDEQTECLAELNTMLDSWSIERLMCYQVTQESFPLSANTVSYTIGSGGTFNTTRPTKIVDPCFIRDSSSLDSQVTLINAEQYGLIVQKSAGITYPQWLYYDEGFNSSALGTISVYPAPSGGLTLFINSWKQLGSVSTISAQFSFPPGYQLAVEANFAIHLAAGSIPASSEVAKIAKESKAAIKGVNLPDPVMRMDYGLATGRSSIFTGP